MLCLYQLEGWEGVGTETGQYICIYMYIYIYIFTPRRGRVRPHQGYKVSYVLVVLLLVVVVVAPGQIF